MSLPAEWTDKIFKKLTLVYGRDFLARWEGVNICDVKTDWSHELAGLEERPKAIAWALQNLPPVKPPTVLEFRKLANTLPAEATVLLDTPRADPARMAEALAKMAPAPVKADGKQWARNIMARYEAGDRIGVYSLKTACAALRLDAPDPGEWATAGKGAAA